MSPESPTILTPGPVGVPDFILDAIGQPVIHQRSPAFIEFFAELQKGLRYLFQTEGPVVVLPSTGSMAVEMTMRSLFPPGSQVAIQSNGKFSDRWLQYGEYSGIKTTPLRLPWGENLDLQTLVTVLKSFPNLDGIVLTHCETSTGVQIDLEEMAFAARQIRPDLLIVVDAMSTVGVTPLYMDAWGLDAVVCSSQKGLFNPSGVSFIGLSLRVLFQMDTPKVDDALHLGHYWRYLSQGSFPFTPPTQLLYGVHEALEKIKELGLPQRWNNSHQMSQFLKKAVVEMGGKLFGVANSDVLTAFSFGGGDQDEIRKALLARGFEVAGGQGEFKGKMMRVGHFGWIGMEEMEGFVGALRDVLEEVADEQ